MDGFASRTAATTSRARVTNRHAATAGSLILLIPNVLFALHLRPLPAAVLIMGVAGAVALLSRPLVTAPGGVLSAPVSWSRLVLCLALALAVLILGGEGHLVFANWDWLWRDAVLADLARAPFPPTYQVAGETFFLRAPLGMYMLPALVAKASSLGAGHAALLVQNASMLALVLYMLATIAGRLAALTLVVFLSFSGLDVFGALLMWLQQGHGLSTFVLPSHLENWIGLQYSSTVTQLFWVPNHALPAYWLAILVLLSVRRELEVGELGLVSAAALFWSPFAFIGVLPFAGVLLARDWRPTFASRRFWLAAAIASGFLPVAFYMTADAAQVPHEFVLFQPFMIATIVTFLYFEIPHIAVIERSWNDLAPSHRLLSFVSAVFLIVLPTVRLGASNDLVMRASIPALTILSVVFAQALALAWPKRPYLLAAGAFLILVGAVTPIQEIVRALGLSRFAISDCNLVTVWKKVAPDQPDLSNYLARRSSLPDRLMSIEPQTALLDRPEGACWPDLRFDPKLTMRRNSNATLRRLDQAGSFKPL